MVKIKKSILLLALIMLTLLFCSFDNKSIRIKHDEDLMVKLDVKIASNTANLKNIKVSYNKSGTDLMSDLTVAINPKDPYTLILNAPMGGWDRDSYYLILDKKVKLASNTYNTKTITKLFQIEAPKVYTISGRISLPNKQIAPVDMPLLLLTVNYRDPFLQQRHDLIIKKGERYVDYKITVPENKSGYYISYDIEPKEYDFVQDKGYVGQSGIVFDVERSKKYLVNKNITVHFTLLENKEVSNAARQLLAKTVKPGMSDYGKVKAIYQEIYKTVSYNFDTYNPFEKGALGEYQGHKLSHTLLDKKAVCAGFANTMQYLLSQIGIECDTRTAEYLSSYSQLYHAWNAVKLDGKYYNMDATPPVSNIISRYTPDIYPMLYSDEFIKTITRFLDEPSYQCNSYDYVSNFYDYWMANPQSKGKTKVINGIIKLPEGEVAPAGGMFVTVNAATGTETVDVKKRFINYTAAFIAEGKNSAEYKLTVVETDAPYIIKAVSGKYGHIGEKIRNYFSQAVKLENRLIEASAIPELVLEEAVYLAGEVRIDKSKYPMNEDIKILICAEEFDGTPSWSPTDSLYSWLDTIKKDNSSVAFKIAVPRHTKPLLLSYEIMNEKPIKGYHRIGYFSDSGTTADYEKAAKIDMNSLTKNYILELVTLDEK